MADNVAITAGSGTTIAADDVSSVYYQRVKLGLGADGTANDAVAGAGVVGTGVQRVTLASDDPAVADLDKFASGNYETVAASQTDQVLGGSGAAGDFFAGLLVVPASTSPGSVTIKDGSNSPDVAITIFAGGTNSVSNLVPFYIPLSMKSTVGGWRVTTGANVSCIGVGKFT